MAKLHLISTPHALPCPTVPVTMRGMESGPQRLAHLVRETRRQLRLTQRQAAERGGISDQTWGVIENARADNFADLTLSGIDQALCWGPGSARRVLEDPDYTPGPTPSPAPPPDELLEDVADLLRRVQETLESQRPRWDRLARGEDEGPRRNSGAR